MKAMILHTLNLYHRYLIILIEMTTYSTASNRSGLNGIPFSKDTLFFSNNVGITLFYPYRLLILIVI